MHETSFEDALEALTSRDHRYHRNGYVFIREALDHTQKVTTRDAKGRIRHVTGQELLEGIRDYALTQYGPMAITVLAEWGITSCRDFGEIVFNMVDTGLLAKTDRDSRTDFESGYDFFEAFRKPYLPASKLAKKTAAKVSLE